MIFSFLLNNKQVNINTQPHRRLSSVLIELMDIKSLQVNCRNGYCGSCIVLLNDKLISSCILMISQVSSSDIKTIEYFHQRYELELLSKAYRNTSANICSYCASAKSLAIISLFNNTLTPSNDDISSISSIVQCKCNSEEQLKETINEFSSLMREYHAKYIHS